MRKGFKNVIAMGVAVAQIMAAIGGNGLCVHASEGEDASVTLIDEASVEASEETSEEVEIISEDEDSDIIIMEDEETSEASFEASSETSSEPSEELIIADDSEEDVYTASGDTSGFCGITANDNVKWAYDADSKTLTLSGKGAIADYKSNSEAPWYSYINSTQYIVVEEGITAIGARNFTYFSYRATGRNEYTWHHPELKLPSTLKSIGERAFEHSSFSGTVTVPKSVTSIGKIAFYQTTIYGDLKLDAQISKIEPQTFYQFQASSLTFPDTVKEICDGAFYWAHFGRRITFPKKLVKIGDEAFSQCTGIERITFTGDAVEVGKEAFWLCRVSLYYPGNNSTWTEAVREKISKEFFGSAWYKTGVAKNNKCGENVTWSLKDGYLSIKGTGPMWDYSNKNMAPWDDEDVNHVTISEGITRVGGYSFYDFNDRSSKRGTKFDKLPSTITEFGPYCFYDCGDFPEFELNSNITYIGDGALFNLQGLTKKVVLPKSLTYIGNSAFGIAQFEAGYDFSNWDNVTYLGDHVFASAYITGTITLPKNLEYLGNDAFERSKVEKVIIPSKKIESLGLYTFAYCENLKSLPESASLKTIGGYAFQYSGLSNAYIGGNIEEIHSESFTYCKNLKTITFGKKVKSISSNVFKGCTALKTVTFEGDLPQIWSGTGSAAFNNSAKNIVVKYDASNPTWKGVTAEKLGMAGLDPVFEPYNTDLLDKDWGEIPDEVVSYKGFKTIKDVPSGLWFCGSNEYLREKVSYNAKEHKLSKLLVFIGTKLLEEGKDYTISYSNNINAGKAQIKVVCKSTVGTGIQGTYVFEIAKAKLSAEYLSFDQGEYYLAPTGKEQKPKPRVFAKFDGEKVELKEGRDYTFDYGNGKYDFTSIGTHYFYLANGDNCEVYRIPFKVQISNKINLSEVQIAKIPDQIYDRMAKRPELKLTYKGKQLVKDKDYSVYFYNNYSIGSGYGKITCPEDSEYFGSRFVAFKIVAPTIKESMFVGDLSPEVYTGKAITKDFDIKCEGAELKGISEAAYNALAEGKRNTYDYIYTYSNNRAVGTAKITIKGVGLCKGQFTKTFKIVANKALKSKKVTIDKPMSTTVATGEIGTLKKSVTFSAHTDTDGVVIWSCSNPKIATITTDGNKVTVTAVKSGSVKITAKTEDGSGKKASITIKVIVPVSALSILPPAGKSGNVLASGKSLKFKAVTGKEFGKPSKAKVKWEYEIYGYSDSEYTKKVEFSKELQEKLHKDKAFFSVKKGKITAVSKKKFEKQCKAYNGITGCKDYGIRLIARTTDGSELKGSVEVDRID